jgi:hypothetical protein
MEHASAHLPQPVHFSFTYRGLSRIATSKFPSDPEMDSTSARVKKRMRELFLILRKLISSPQRGGHSLGK